MLTAINEFKPEYTAQITAYHGKVNVCIICTKSYYYNTSMKLWISIMDKSFGSLFRSAPRQIDWERANVWANKQMELISRFSTDIIINPKELK